MAFGDNHLRGVALLALGWVWWRAWSPLVTRDAAALCMAGVWHLAASSSSFHMAGMVLGDIHLRSAWHFWHWARSGGPLCVAASFCVAEVALMALGWLWWRAWSLLVARGNAALCVASVALGNIYRDFVAGAALGDIHLRFASALCVAGVALCDNHLRFAWQLWHLETSTLVLCGRRK